MGCVRKMFPLSDKVTIDGKEFNRLQAQLAFALFSNGALMEPTKRAFDSLSIGWGNSKMTEITSLLAEKLVKWSRNIEDQYLRGNYPQGSRVKVAHDGRYFSTFKKKSFSNTELERILCTKEKRKKEPLFLKHF